MAPSIIYFIPPNPATSASEQPLLRLQHNIRHNLHSSALPRWTLEHRLFRETAPANTPAKLSASAVPVSLLQCLTLSWKLGKTWVGIIHENERQSSANSLPAPAPAAATATDAVPKDGSPVTEIAASTTKDITSIASIPASSLDEFWSLLALRLSPLWQPRGGGIISVRDGIACRVADFIVRVGELRLVVPSAAANAAVPVSRGTVCQIVYVGDEIPADAAGDVIAGVWEIISTGARGREIVYKTHTADKGEEEVQVWMEALRGRDGRS